MNQYVLTFITKSETELTVETVNQLISDNLSNDVKLTKQNRLSKRAIDQYFETGKDKIITKDTINVNGWSQDVDVILQNDDKYRQNKKLVVFDMDSTLIYQEVIELIAKYADVEPQVKAITDRAMNNEIDFKESLRERVSLLKGLKIDHIYDEIKTQLILTNGVQELCSILKAKGIKLAVLSGGFVPFAKFIQEKLEMDFMRANNLETDKDGILTGKVMGDIVDGECKAMTILELCDEFNIALEETMMIGDGGNDLPAMGVAGFGIAWNAKPRVQLEAPCKLNTNSLRDVLYIMGFADDDNNN